MGLQPDRRYLHVRGIGQELFPGELLPHKHPAGNAECHQMKCCPAQIDANRLYLQVDDPPS
jgi:hypothetical protein